MKFPSSVFESLLRWYDKSKVIVQKILKMFGTFNGVAIGFTDIVGEMEIFMACHYL